ncbi:MAG: hypothetical protein ABSG46_17010 [Candidatus Binataceae bacterium]|jgi:hypothetical protein
MTEQWPGGYFEHNGWKVPSPLAHGVPLDATEEAALAVELNVPVDTLRDDFKRISEDIRELRNKAEDDRAETARFREQVRTDLGVIGTRHNDRFKAHEDRLDAIDRRINGWNGDVGLIRNMDNVQAKISGYGKGLAAAWIILSGVLIIVIGGVIMIGLGHVTFH